MARDAPSVFREELQYLRQNALNLRAHSADAAYESLLRVAGNISEILGFDRDEFLRTSGFKV